ncbi:hypothetical protein KHA80_14400 [Anaerobacillus sp. HL2]|nr:hypothetical protein KHA80_14400 [Anaerobacillus sp. HL2]
MKRQQAFLMSTHILTLAWLRQRIIGGVDAGQVQQQWIRASSRIFPLFRLVPGQILAPGWSHDPVVGAIMKAKSSSINGLFKAISVADVDSFCNRCKSLYRSTSLEK